MAMPLGKEEEANKLSFADLVGNGGILVISAFPENGVRYQGIVALDQDNLSRCLEEYFKDSEQLPTTLQLYHDIEQAQSGGLMLQIIPNIEHNIESLAHLSTLSATLTAEELFFKPARELTPSVLERSDCGLSTRASRL